MTARALRFGLMAAVFCFTLAAAVATLPAQDNQKTVFVSVLDDKGKPVTDMTVADFAIREDNADREVIAAKKSDQPLSVILLVDTTTEAQGFIQDIRAALKGFLEVLQQGSPQSEVALWEFGQAAIPIKDFTTDYAVLQREAGRVYPKQRAASVLLEALHETTQQLGKRKNARRAIITVNVEPSKEVSTQNPQEVLNSLIRSRSQVWSVSVQRTKIENATRDVVLNRFVQVGGGRREFVFTDNAVEVLLRDYAASLVNQYEVTYVRPSGKPQIVQVGARRDGVKTIASIVAPQ